MGIGEDLQKRGSKMQTRSDKVSQASGGHFKLAHLTSLAMVCGVVVNALRAAHDGKSVDDADPRLFRMRTRVPAGGAGLSRPSACPLDQTK
jgi:hypothetical protein